MVNKRNIYDKIVRTETDLDPENACYLEYYTMDKVKERIDAKCYLAFQW
jgi:hypothetical protein